MVMVHHEGTVSSGVQEIVSANTTTASTSQIANYFRHKDVLITGGTGFVGKVLLHKLLTTCPDIGKIFLLIRVKKNSRPQERLDALIKDSPIFDELRLTIPSVMDRVEAIAGDIAEPNLGISSDDRAKLQTSVAVVFHSAATVKFDDELSRALALNVHGTRAMMALAKKMTKLEAFVHVSTAYCHCNRSFIEEKIYNDESLQLKNIQDIAESTPEDVKAQVILPRPNTYTFSKAMAEQLLVEERDDIPVAIVRPSIVVGAHKEPIPGWVDNFNGPTSIIIGVGHGILRTMIARREALADFIPVDHTVNLLCAVAYALGTKKLSQITKDPVPVFNCTSGNLNPLRWGELQDWGFGTMLKYPMENIFWYPTGSFKSSEFVDSLTRLIVNWIPAYIYDGVCGLMGHKPTLVPITKKMVKSTKALSYFTCHEWKWSNENTEGLRKGLTEEDQRKFNFDIAAVDWRQFFDDYVKATRQYVMKYKPDTLEASRKRLKQLYILHNLIKVIVYAGIIYLVWAIFLRDLS